MVHQVLPDVSIQLFNIVFNGKYECINLIEKRSRINYNNILLVLYYYYLHSIAYLNNYLENYFKRFMNYVLPGQPHNPLVFSPLDSICQVYVLETDLSL